MQPQPEGPREGVLIALWPVPRCRGYAGITERPPGGKGLPAEEPGLWSWSCNFKRLSSANSLGEPGNGFFPTTSSKEPSPTDTLILSM